VAVGGGPDAWGRTVFQFILAEEVPALLAKMIRVFLKQRNEKELFDDFCRRHGDEDLKGLFETCLSQEPNA